MLIFTSDVKLRSVLFRSSSICFRAFLMRSLNTRAARTNPSTSLEPSDYKINLRKIQKNMLILHVFINQIKLVFTYLYIYKEKKICILEM